MPNPKPLRSITIIRDADNRSLEHWGMPYRYDAAGYAVCANCGY